MPLSSKLYSCSTRTENILAYNIPSSRCDYHLYSFFPRTVRDWNTLPQQTVELGTVEAFKQAIYTAWSWTPGTPLYLQCREQRPYPEELNDDCNLHLHLHLHYCPIKMFIPSCCTCRLMLFTESLPFRCIIPPLMLRSLHPIEVVGIITKKKKMLHSSKRWWLWKEPVLMYGEWNVRQATLQQFTVQSDHLLHGYMLPVFFITDQLHRPLRAAEIQPMLQRFRKFSRDLTHQKSLKSVNFDSYLKN